MLRENGGKSQLVYKARYTGTTNNNYNKRRAVVVVAVVVVVVLVVEAVVVVGTRFYLRHNVERKQTTM